MSLTILSLLFGLVIPPGGNATICRTTLAKEEPVVLAPGVFADTVVNLYGRWGITVNLGNFDYDPEPEIACRLSLPAPQNLNITKLVVLDNDLTVVWSDSWGYSGNPEMASITIADIDNDGRDDIIVPFAETFFETQPQYKGRIYVLDGMTGATKPGWPFILPGWPEHPYHKTHSEVAVADINDDGEQEIVVQVEDLGSIRKPGCGVYVLRPTGDSLWKFLFYTDTLDRHGAYTSPAVCDLDGNGQMEIVCHVGHFARDYPYPLIERRLFIMNSDGTVRRQWQTEGPGAGYTPDYASPTVGDITGDNAPEIIVARRTGWLDCYDTLGNMLPGFPINLHNDARYYPNSAGVTRAFATPALADLDNDLMPEIICGSSGRESCNTRWAGRIHAFRANGTPVPGFPVPTRNAIWYSPAVGNVDTTPTLEILTAGCDSSFYIIDINGDSLPGWPVRDFPTYWLPDRGSYAFIEGIIPMSRTPFIADRDGNGLLEIMMEGSDGTFHLWKTSAPNEPDLMPCPTFRFNKERTGWFRTPSSGVASSRRGNGRGPVLIGPSVCRAGLVRLSLPEVTKGRLVVRDCAGRLVQGRRVDSSSRTVELDLSGLPAGIYFIQFDGLGLASRLVLME
ncbi:MAG: hypothetical protein ABIK44_01640 [candidate division WOR-3 bacterium]